MMGDTAHHGNDRTEKATLYVVATPIGNLKDVTHRALEVLSSVAVVAAEDTRITSRLLDHYGIRCKLIALHEHNERSRVEQVLGLLAGGRSVALVTDAGTPGISDPGAHVVAAVRDAGFPVSPVPGPSAAIAALSASGLEVPFLFYGFLPSRHAERVKALQALAAVPYTLVFYEAPHRVVESVRDLADVLGGGRRLVIARELTKRFESMHACTLEAAEAWLQSDEHRVRGEFVFVVAGAAPAADEGAGAEAQRVLQVLLAELPLKQAVGLAVRLTGGKRNELYETALAMKRE